MKSFVMDATLSGTPLSRAMAAQENVDEAARQTSLAEENWHADMHARGKTDRKAKNVEHKVGGGGSRQSTD